MTEITQVNISVDNETLAILEDMAKEDGFDNRSAFIRRLIRMEHKRREDQRFELTPKGQMALKIGKDK